MRLSFRFMGIEIVGLDFAIPRLGMFLPEGLPDSIEAIETWGDTE